MTLTETLVSAGLTLCVVGTAFALVAPASRASMTQPEVADVQQRARVAVETIGRDLGAAGAGTFGGTGTGVLGKTIPAFLARRLGSAGDAAGVVRSDAITGLSIPSTAAQTTIASAISPASLTLSTTASAGCGAAVLCGIAVGDDVLVATSAGQFDVFRVTKIAGGVGTLRPHSQQFAATYAAGSTVSAVVSRSYYLDTSTRILRQYDGDQNDQPVVDHLASLTFSYFGEGPSGGLEKIPVSAFGDGPWIGVGASQFDADLLRVRQVRVSAFAEAAPASLRQRTPMATFALDVLPRSLTVGR